MQYGDTQSTVYLHTENFMTPGNVRCCETDYLLTEIKVEG